MLFQEVPPVRQRGFDSRGLGDCAQPKLLNPKTTRVSGRRVVLQNLDRPADSVRITPRASVAVRSHPELLTYWIRSGVLDEYIRLGKLVIHNHRS